MMIDRIKRQLKSLFFEGEVLKLMSLTFLTKPIGLISQMLMAKYYGAGIEYDAYILSFFLVTFVGDLFGRVFSAVAIPHLTALRQKLSERDMTAYVNALVLVSMLPLGFFTVILLFKGIWVVNLAAPNAPEETRQLAVRMLRVMAVPGILVALVRIMKSVLNAHSAFRVPAALPILNSVTILCVLMVGHEALGIWALPTAFVISFCVQSLVMMGFAVKRGFIAAVRPRAERNDLFVLWRRGWMVVVDAAIMITNTFVDKFFASGLAAGSISAIAYATTLMNFGMQMFHVSLVAVMFTRMSELVAKDDIEACNRYLDLNLRRLSRLAVPACLAVSMASFEVVRVLFERDAFSADDTARTAGALSMYLLGLPAFLVNLVVVRTYHAFNRLRDRMWLTLQYLVTNVIGNMLLVGPLQVVGLAVSSTMAINIHLALSIWMLSRYRVGLQVGHIFGSVLVHYVLGFATWAIYRFSGLAELLDGYSHAADRWGAMLVGLVRAGGIGTIYVLLMLVRRQVSRSLGRRA